MRKFFSLSRAEKRSKRIIFIRVNSFLSKTARVRDSRDSNTPPQARQQR